MDKSYKSALLCFIFCLCSCLAFASGANFNDSTQQPVVPTAAGNVGLGTTLPVNKLAIVGNIGVGTVAYSNYLRTTAPNGGAIFEGNVGIGTWVPTQDLVVADSGNPTVLLSRLGTALGSFYGNVNSFGYPEAVYSSATPSSGRNITVSEDSSDYNGDAGVNTDASLARFEINDKTTASIPAMYISSDSTSVHGDLLTMLSNGNMGIGTIDPKNKLDVVSGVGIGTGINSTYLTTAAPAGGMIVQGNVGLGTWAANSSLIIYTGNVGIGSIAPGKTLDINGTIRTVAMLFQSEVSNGTCNNATVTINWNTGNKQTVIIGPPTCNIAFTAPTGGVANLTLRVVQDASGSRVVNSWTASPKWVGGVAPTLTASANAVDIITCYYNGTSYFCAASLNFS